MWALAFTTLIVGFLLGWLVAWMLQRRLNDSLTGQVAQLQQELDDCNRKLSASDSASGAVQTEAGEAVVAAAVVETAEVETTEGEAAEGEAVEGAAVEETAEGETVVEEAVVVETRADTGVAAAAVVAAVAVEEAAEQPEETPVIDRDEGVADLTVIKGIGPKFAETLTAGGITSYAALADATPERLQEIVQPAAWQKVDFEDWIAQASALSRQSRRLQIGDDLTRLEGIGPAYAQRLRAAGITTFAQLTESDEDALASIVDAPAWQRINYGDWIAQAKLAAAGDEAGLKELQGELFSRKDDNIGLIQGIGSTTQAALTGAGITTYAQLADATPEQLGEIMSEAGVRRGNFDAWIEEAKQRAGGRRVSRSGARTRSIPAGSTATACPQDLGEVAGLGETYEQRLYNSGIGTFWEVGMLPQEELGDLLEIQDFQGVDLDAIQASARSLAESTDSVGRVWDGTEPDDFEPLEGIGEVYERRLYDAGICTFAAMAQISEEQLAEICQAPANFTPNYARWLEQAQEEIA